MSGELDVDSFEKAINGLNENLGQVGLLFKANMPLIGSEATQERRGIPGLFPACKTDISKIHRGTGPEHGQHDWNSC